MPWQWDLNTDRYRDLDTGRFISAETIRGLVDERQRITGSGSDGLAELLRGGQLNTRDWETGMREAIKDEYIQQYLLGRGGLSQMTQADWGSIGGMVADQYRYLDGFAQEVAAGTLTEAQVAARARMYINSGREAYERASARAHGLPELPAYPGDGKTICLTNCACNWRIEEVYDDNGNLVGWNCYWELGEAEHCPDCVANSSRWNPLFIEVSEEVPEEDRELAEPVAEPVKEPAELVDVLEGKPPVDEDTTTARIDDWFVRDLDSSKWKGASLQDRQIAKDEIIRELSKRTGTTYEDVDKLIRQWAFSSNDDDMRSLAIQRDVAELFGIPMSEFTKDGIARIETAKETSLWYRLHPGKVKPEHAPLMESTEQQKLIKAMYDYTQEELRAAGFGSGTTIRLRRGIVLDKSIVGDWRKGSIQEIIANPLESWSSSASVAKRFASGLETDNDIGIVLEMDVPVEWLVGSARTGFGCLDEGEFVILGGLEARARVIDIVLPVTEEEIIQQIESETQYVKLPPLDSLLAIIGAK